MKVSCNWFCFPELTSLKCIWRRECNRNFFHKNAYFCWDTYDSVRNRLLWCLSEICLWIFSCKRWVINLDIYAHNIPIRKLSDKLFKNQGCNFLEKKIVLNVYLSQGPGWLNYLKHFKIISLSSVNLTFHQPRPETIWVLSLMNDSIIIPNLHFNCSCYGFIETCFAKKKNL